MSSDGGFDRLPSRLSEANSRLKSRLVRSDQAVDDLKRDNVNLGAKASAQTLLIVLINHLALIAYA